MILVIYIFTIIFFWIAAMIVPNVYIALAGKLRVLMNIRPATDPFSVLPHLFSAILLMMLIEAVWGKLGYEPGWILIGILALIHFLWPGQTVPAQSNAYGTMFGLIIYGIYKMAF